MIAGGTPLADARAFAQWRAAYRLVVRGGARTTLTDAATLGLLDRVERAPAPGVVPPSADEIDVAFWGACHGCRAVLRRCTSGAGRTAQTGYPAVEHRTALDAAVRRGATELVRLVAGAGRPHRRRAGPATARTHPSRYADCAAARTTGRTRTTRRRCAVCHLRGRRPRRPARERGYSPAGSCSLASS